MVRDWTIRRKPLCRGILRDYTSDIRRDEKRCSRDTLAVLHVSPAKSVRIVREPMETDEDRVHSGAKAPGESERNSLSGKFRPARME